MPRNQNFKWGVDSKAQTTFSFPVRNIPRRYRNGRSVRDEITWHKYVEERLTLHAPTTLRQCRFPEFWARYLNETTSRTMAPLTKEESRQIAIASESTCRILPIYNGRFRNGDRGDLTGSAARENGRKTAENAAKLATDLEIPHSVRLFVDLERWRVSEDWFLGWFDQMCNEPYVGGGGIYGNVEVWGTAIYYDHRTIANHRITRSRYATLSDDEKQLYRRTTVRSGFNRTLQSAAARVLGVTDEGDPGATEASPALEHAPADPAENCATVWSNRPYLGHINGNNARREDYSRLFEMQFRPVQAPESHLYKTEIWQYGAQLNLGTSLATIDMNMCTEAALNEMYLPSST